MSNNVSTYGSGDTSPDEVRRKRNATLSILFVCSVLFPAGVATVLIMWLMVSVKKNQPKVVYAVYGIAILPLLIALYFYTPWAWHTGMHMVNEVIAQHASLASLLWVYIMKFPYEILLGGAVGCVYVAYRMFFRDKWEELEFKPTPIQVKKKRKNIDDIRHDRNSPTNGRTLGIETYRYFPKDEKGIYKKNRGPVHYGERLIQADYEAGAHTLVLGASGSGKALDEDTPILTPSGYVRMGDLEGGDLVYNINMRPIPVLAALPLQEDKPAYTFSYDNGESITSDEEHLWTLANGKTLTTAQIVKRFEHGEDIDIPAPRRQPVWFFSRSPIEDALDSFIAGSLYHLQHHNLMGGQQGCLTSAEWLNRGYNLTQSSNGLYTPDSSLSLSAEDVQKHLFGPIDERRAFLFGMLYTGGFLINHQDCAQAGITGHVVGYESQNEAVLASLVQLATGLGIHLIRVEDTVLMSTNLVPEMKTSKFDIRSGYTHELETLKSTQTRYRLTNVEATKRTVRCIKVGSADGLFLAGHSCVPTHNTTTLLLMARDLIKRGRGFGFLDLKGGDDIPKALKEYADRYGRRFIHWTMHDSYTQYEGPSDNGPGYYDPITRGDPTRRKDLILAMRQWDAASDVYKNATAAYLQLLFDVIRLSPHPDPNMDTLTDVIDLMQGAQALMARLDEVRPDRRDANYERIRKDVANMTMSNNKVQKDSVSTTAQTLQVFAHSIAGPWLGKDPTGEQDINLWDIADEGAVVCFSLDSSNYPDLSQNVANLIIQDLKTASSEFRRNKPRNPLDIFIDEFAAIESDNLTQLVNKSRDAGIGVTFSTQTIADMKNVSDTLGEQLNGIISSFIVHRVNSDKEAETYAGIFGKEKKATVMKEVEHTSGIFGGIGRGSATGSARLTYEDDFIVPIEKLQNLTTGHAVYHTKATGDRGGAGRTYYVTVIPEFVADNKEVRVLDSSTMNRYQDMPADEEMAHTVTDLPPKPTRALPSQQYQEAPQQTYEEENYDDPYEKPTAPAMHSPAAKFARARGGEQSTPPARQPQRNAQMSNSDNDDKNLPDSYDFAENTPLGEIEYKGRKPDINKLVNFSVLSKREQYKAQMHEQAPVHHEPEPAQPQYAPEEEYVPEESYEPRYEPEEDYWEEPPAPAPAPKPVRSQEAPAAQKSPAAQTRPKAPRPSRPARPQRPSGVSAPPARPGGSAASRPRPQGKPAGVPSVPKKNMPRKGSPLPEMKPKATKKITDSEEIDNKYSW